MKAVICKKYGSPELLHILEVEKPILKNKTKKRHIKTLINDFPYIRAHRNLLYIIGDERVLQRLVK